VGGVTVSIPWIYAFFVFLLMTGLSNAVNLTDGLDGLAGGTVLVVMLFMAMVAYRYDEINLAVFAAATAGACVGFLWFNSYPASIFMGDTGSLALGSAFAALAVLTKTEVTSLVMGGLFVVEALSVLIQVASFKLTGKRVFLMAPLHHHFEKKGWSETKVVIRFWIVSAAFAAIGFALFFQLT
jgi:phospho-N-acetylmuramoyl-pentapeptide-transferase